MDPIELTPAHRNRIRFRHALRTGIGAASLASVTLHVQSLSGCIGFVLFFVSAGINELDRYQGSVIKASVNVLIGALLGYLAFAIQLLVANENIIVTFFISLPVLFLFISIRTDDNIGLISTIANVVFGTSTISRFGVKTRADIPHLLLTDFLTSIVPFAIAILPTLFFFPDRAGDAGRSVLARELCELGTAISKVATATFSKSLTKKSSNSTTFCASTTASEQPHISLFVEHDRRDVLKDRFLANDMVFLNENAPGMKHLASLTLDHTKEMIASSQCSLQFLQALRPFGRSRVSSFGALARAKKLLSIAETECPFVFGREDYDLENPDPAIWRRFIEVTTSLLNKIAALESVACLRRGEPFRFSQQTLAKFVGEAYQPLWVVHMASCAAACQAISNTISGSGSADTVYLPQFGKQNKLKVKVINHQLDAIANPKAWKRRRVEMYFGILLRYRLEMRNKDPVVHGVKFKEIRHLEAGPLKALDLEYNVGFVNKRRNLPINRKERVGSYERQYDPLRAHGGKGRNQRPIDKFLEKQALSFFTVTCHAISEEIGNVRNVIKELETRDKNWKLHSILSFMLLPLRHLWERIIAMKNGNIEKWEIRFFFTHWFLLASVFGISLFVPGPTPIGRPEMGWIFTSAVLSTQLSAEPTTFISVLRILTTIGGVTLGFLFSLLLQIPDRSKTTLWDLFAIPFMAILCFTCCLVFPLRYRYAGFLTCVTCALILFCPRGGRECLDLESIATNCFPTWEYAVARATNVSIGVVLSVLFHVIFFPRYISDVTTGTLSNVIVCASRLLRKIRRTYFSYGASDGIRFNRAKAVWGTDDDSSNREDILFSEEIYKDEESVIEELNRKLTSPVSGAMMAIKMQSSLWKVGPLRLYPLLPRLVPDYLALAVSLSELGGLLRRRLVFSSRYSPEMYSQVILPALNWYETAQISIRNLVGIVDRALFDKKNEKLRENAFDLNEAVTHLARIRSHLRLETSKLVSDVQNQFDLNFNVRKQLNSWSKSYCRKYSRDGSNDVEQEKSEISRKWKSVDDTHTVSRQAKADEQISLDDLVLYNTFSFVADGCLSAFLRIAIGVLIHAESTLRAQQSKKKSCKNRKKEA